MRGRGKRGQSTPPHAKLALISCAAQRAMTPKQQFYSKGEDPQGLGLCFRADMNGALSPFSHQEK